MLRRARERSRHGISRLQGASKDSRSHGKPLAKMPRLDDKCAQLAPVQPGATERVA
jgi:hypothetical protein